MRIILIVAFIALVGFVVWDYTQNNGMMTYRFVTRLEEFVRSLAPLKDIRRTPSMPI